MRISGSNCWGLWICFPSWYGDPYRSSVCNANKDDVKQTANGINALSTTNSSCVPLHTMRAGMLFWANTAFAVQTKKANIKNYFNEVRKPCISRSAEIKMRLGSAYLKSEYRIKMTFISMISSAPQANSWIQGLCESTWRLCIYFRWTNRVSCHVLGVCLHFGDFSPISGQMMLAGDSPRVVNVQRDTI